MIVMYPIALPHLLQVEAILVKLDALWLSHIKNHDLTNMLLMANTGAYSNWVSHMTLTGLLSDSCILRIGMCSIDMATGVMLGCTISIRTGINYG